QGHDGTGQPPGSVRAGPVPDRAHPGGGATIRELGTRDDPAGWDDGYFLRPAVVTDIDPGAEPVTGEQFGPIVPIIAFDRDDEAVRLANGTDYGLAASVWTADQAHGLAVARRLEAGTVFLNTHRAGASDVSMPFGGVKRSGIGRLHGVAALDACTEPQTIASYTDVSGFPGPPPLVAQAVSQVVPRTVPQKGE
ncbi:MAG: aldehyde dehydrogenase family protein, partial [Nocardiopsaceae bacterium]|nr:aldehyde dehydrogenase family protein [Nocardiopsaceae bacterium]